MSAATVISLLEESSIEFPLHFINCSIIFLVWIIKISYMVCKSASSNLWFANIFSNPIGCLYTQLINFFVMQTPFSLR